MKKIIIALGVILTAVLSFAVREPQLTSAAGPVAFDTFNRNQAEGWGTADNGGAYALAGTPANFGVNGSTGTITVAAGSRQSAFLTGVSGTNGEINFRFKTDKVSEVAASQFVYLLARRTGEGNQYLARVRVTANGTVKLQALAEANGRRSRLGSETTVRRFKLTPDTYLRVRIQVAGNNPTTIQMRVWLEGRLEPSGWQYKATDASPSLQGAGTVGLSAFLNRKAVNGPVQVSFDDLDVSELAPSSNPGDPAQTPLPSPTATPTDIVAPTDASSPTDAPLPTNTVAASSTPVATKSPTRTATSVPTNTKTNTPANSPTATRTATSVPTNTRTNTPTNVPTNTRTSTPAPTSPSTITDGPAVYWGVYMPEVPYDMSKLTTFETNAGKKVSILHWGAPWKNSNGSFQSFQTAYFDRARQHGSIPMLTWGSWQLGRGMNQADFQNSDIYNGTYDSFIRQWATDAKNWGHPFFLRFDWEMNGWWQFPWAEGQQSDGTIVNGNNSGDYVKMYRHVHDIFTQVGANNVTWVWCPNIYGPNNPRYPALSAVYPGDAYVDWTCLDGYNEYSTWMSLSQIFTGQGITWLRNSYQDVLNVAPNKPMMIGETGALEAGDGGVKKGQWLQNGYSNELPNNMPKVKAILYFNWNDNDPNKTFMIDSTPLSQQGFTAGIGSNYFASNIFANLDGGAILPLR